MVTHTLNLCSAFNPSKWTHTHPEQWAAILLWHLGSSWGLAQGSHLRCGIEGGRECWLFTPPTDNSCRTWDSNPWPLGYKSDSLSIRPQLPTIIKTNSLIKTDIFHRGSQWWRITWCPDMRLNSMSWRRSALESLVLFSNASRGWTAVFTPSNVPKSPWQALWMSKWT